MIPIVFCASLAPCVRLSNDDDTNCRIRNLLSTAKGVERNAIQDTARTNAMASIRPVSGDSTMAVAILLTPLQTTAGIPAFATPAPTRPPTRAWLLLDGMPNH